MSDSTLADTVDSLKDSVTSLSRRLDRVETGVNDRIDALEERITDLSHGADGVHETTGELATGDWHDLDGLRVVQDPEKHLAGSPIDKKLYGTLPYLEHTGHKLIPNMGHLDYIPCSLPGDVDASHAIASRMARGTPAYLEGEAGMAKNTAIAALCGETNRVLRRDNYGMDTSVFQVVNDTDVVNGTTINNLGNLTMSAMFGGVYNADEGNMATGDITSHLHAIFEEEGSRSLSIVGTDRTLIDLPEDVEWDPDEHLGQYIHPEFKVVATGNPLTYASTKPMNHAFRDRFSIQDMKYIGAGEEAGLLQDETGIEEEKALKFCELAVELRNQREEGALNCPISHRRLILASQYVIDHNTSLSAAAEAEIKSYAQNAQSDKPSIQDAIDDIL